MVALSSVTPETWQTAPNTPQGLKSIPHPHPVTLFLFFLLHPLLQFWGFLSLITSYVIFFQCTRGSYFVTKPTGPWPRPLCKSGPLSVTCRKSCFLLQGCMQQSLSLPYYSQDTEEGLRRPGFKSTSAILACKTSFHPWLD